MATLHLICGLPGAGKTTLAAKLAAEHNALRLSPDEWISRLSADARDEPFRDRVLALQTVVALDVLKLGRDVVFDHGCWGCEERASYRAAAEGAGAGYRLYYLDVPSAELKRRLALRNASRPPHAFTVTAEDIDAWTPLFEAPLSDEPGLVHLRG